MSIKKAHCTKWSERSSHGLLVLLLIKVTYCVPHSLESCGGTCFLPSSSSTSLMSEKSKKKSHVIIVALHLLFLRKFKQPYMSFLDTQQKSRLCPSLIHLAIHSVSVYRALTTHRYPEKSHWEGMLIISTFFSQIPTYLAAPLWSLAPCYSLRWPLHPIMLCM